MSKSPTNYQILNLPVEPKQALEVLRKVSKTAPTLVLKKSPTCGISAAAETEFRSWLESRKKNTPLNIAILDVLAERTLARGLTEQLGIKHESPQALLFSNGELSWHGSHGDLNFENFNSKVDGAP